MDHRTGQILDAIKEAGIENDTLVIFTSDNGPEATHPWEGDSGPWRGTYFTAMEGSLVQRVTDGHRFRDREELLAAQAEEPSTLVLWHVLDPAPPPTLKVGQTIVTT